jgi:hypothetical protein
MLSRQLISNLLTAPAMSVFIVPLFSYYAPLGTGDISPLISTVVGIIFLSILPSIPVLLAVRRGGQDFEVSEKSQRSTFFMLALISYGVGAVIYHFTHSQTMFTLCVAFVLVTVIITVINQFWKISVHSTGSAGLITAMVWVLGLWMLPLYLLTAATLVIRYKMEAHDLKQLGAGAVMAIIVTLSVFWYLQ